MHSMPGVMTKIQIAHYHGSSATFCVSIRTEAATPWALDFRLEIRVRLEPYVRTPVTRVPFSHHVVDFEGVKQFCDDCDDFDIQGFFLKKIPSSES